MGSYFPIRQRFQLFYAVEFTGVGIFLAYVALYLIHLGLSGIQIGLLLSLLPLAAFLLQPVWGLLSDIYGLRRALLTLGCLGVALSALALSYVTEFRWLFLIMLLMSIMRGPIAPISAALALDFPEKEEQQDDFGIGPSLGLFTAGYLYETGGSTLIWAFCLIAGLIGLAIIAWSARLPHLNPVAERSQL